jgi:hypothetical protein
LLSQPEHRVHQLRHILMWPLQISPVFAGAHQQAIRDALIGSAGNFAVRGPWAPVADEFEVKAGEQNGTAGVNGGGVFGESHYKEFVTFLPYVQRFLYGEARSPRRPRDDPPAEASVEVFRRRDVARLRVQLRPDSAAFELEARRVELYLFSDLDIVVLAVELEGRDLRLDDALDFLHRFGRAYPAGWDAGGAGLHHTYRAEWLAADGSVLAASDTADREKYLRYAQVHRAPAVAAHWDFMVSPLVLDQSDAPGAFRYRLIEYYRMPFMAYLALDNPRALTREDFLRIGLVSQLRPADSPSAEQAAEFEHRICEDRFWTDQPDGPHTRFLLNGQSLIVTGNANSGFFTDATHGQLAQFRHQIFLLFLIAHLHRGALLSFSDHLADATADLDERSAVSVRRFKQRIRIANESFLRFTHRYWFHELSEHPLVQRLFLRTTEHLNNGLHYRDVREELRDMADYLDSDAQRRQAGTMMRLTVVTTFGLIGTVATGFLGMNLIAAADAPMATRVGFFTLVLAGAGLLTLFAVARSARLAELLETVSSERASRREKIAACAAVFRRRPE